MLPALRAGDDAVAAPLPQPMSAAPSAPSSDPPAAARSLPAGLLLKQLELLLPGDEAVFNQIAGIAAQAAGVPAALVGFFGPESATLKGRHGWAGDVAALHPALCSWQAEADGLLWVADARTDARLQGLPLVSGEPQWLFYAGHPVRYGGQVLGAVCLFDQRPRAAPAAAAAGSGPAVGPVDAGLAALLANLAGLVAEVLRARHERVLRQQTQRRAADLAAASGDWAWETDAEHRYHWLSSNFELRTGTRPADWIGRRVNPLPLLDPLGDPLQPVQTFLALLQRQQRFSNACIDTAQLGDCRVLSISAAPLHDDGGRFLGFRGITKDVTQQVQTQRAARERQMKQLAAEQASKNKSELLSRVSHELRTPLNAILGFSQLALLDQREPLPPAQQRRIEAIHAGGERLLALIDDMLAAARAEHSQRTLVRQPLDLALAVRKALALLLPQAGRQSVQLHERLPAGLLVLADDGAVGQVLLNLIGNAIKYNRPGGRVRLQAEATEGLVRLRISDQGPGLRDEQLARLFQPFDRLGAEQTTVPGTGLGLVISRTLVDAMGGTLAFESEPGQGTCAILGLPAARADGAAMPPPDAAPVPPPPLPRPAGALRRQVLYIEDDAVNVQLMQQLFQTEPAWQLRIATTGREGLAMAAQSPPDLLLLDMNLPDMHGLDVLQALRAAGVTPPLGCVAVSADAMPPQIERARAAGCDDYWTKPLDMVVTWHKLVGRLMPAPPRGA